MSSIFNQPSHSLAQKTLPLPEQSPSAPPGAFLSAESFYCPAGAAERLKVAAYIRVSTNMTDQLNSFETQEKYFRQLLARNQRWIFAGIYSDRGISGTSRDKRTGFQRLLRHCREGRIDRIICKSISRFARNTKDFMEALHTLRECKVTVLFEKEGLDTAEATSAFILTTLAAIAQEESRSISTNIRWSNEKRFPRGDVPNQAIYGYRFTGAFLTAQSGYRYRDVEIIPEEAQVVQWVFEQAAEGVTYAELARALNRQRVPRKISAYTRKRMEHSAEGQLNSGIDEGWTGSQIRGIVRNERYTGDILIQKTYTEDYLSHKTIVNHGQAAQYIVRDHHPAIISRELFQAANEVKSRGEKHSLAPYALSGRLICGCCGRFYHLRNAGNHGVWFCPSTARNNGKILCQSEKLMEEQIVRMFQWAVTERFRRIEPSVKDGTSAGDIMSGQYDNRADTGEAMSPLVRQMLNMLENIQKMDFVERDRVFMREEIQSARAAAEEAEERIKALTDQHSSAFIRRSLFDRDDAMDALLAELEQQIAAEKDRCSAAASRKEKAMRQLDYLEGYWEKLEEDYGYRAAAIQWLKELPAGKAGETVFYKELTGSYVRAFLLSITVYDPLRYCVRWFDDTTSQVDLRCNLDAIQNQP